MWRILRTCCPNAHFRRQAPIRDFITDFASHGLKLVVEVDGGQHGGQEDEERTALIEAEGYRVVRFWNHEVLGNDDGVAKMLATYCVGSTQPSPIKGEGFDERPGS
jgi:very-short-patch-repair endonuclease